MSERVSNCDAIRRSVKTWSFVWHINTSLREGGFHEEGPHRTSTCHPSITAHTERAPQRIRNKIQIVQRKGGLERLHLTSNDRRKDREKIRKHLIELDANWTNATGRKALNATRETIPRITNKSSPYTPWYCVSKSSELRRDRMTWKRLVMR